MEYTMRKWLLVCGCLLACLLMNSCHRYYKAVTKPNTTHAGAIDSLQLQHRYFVLRNGPEAFYMKDMALSADRSTVTCTLDTLAPEHRFHLVNGRRGKKAYKKSRPEEVAVLSEVHLYTAPGNSAAPGQYSLPLEKVQKIEVIERDVKRTTNSYVIGAIGYTLGAAVVVAVIIAATKSSCPFVSAYDGQQFSLQGEIYGGAVYPQLARHDYMPLQMAPLVDGTLQLKISNELQERQYTDIAHLIVITHDTGSSVLADMRGHLYAIRHPQTPVAASLNGVKDVTAALQHHHDNTLLYMDDTSTANGINTVRMRFDRAPGAGKAKLVLALKNSYWLDYLYGELMKGFGRYYSLYIKQQRKKPAAELLKWVREQQIPLQVAVKTDTGWRTVETINTIGPVATREVIVPLDLAGMAGDEVQVRLSTGFMFWELDYAAIDYSQDERQLSTTSLLPVSATDERGRDVSGALQHEDGIYLDQPSIGNVATIVYKSAPLTDPSKKQSFLLHTKGYYEHVRHFTGGVNKAFLEQFKKPGAFTAYSSMRYRQFHPAALTAFTKP